jgi:undecaprenyl-diphosphatase
MNIFSVIILAIVEGITEFLPVSSTGHLILISKLLGIPQTEFLKSFEISIQLGAILSVVILYWRQLATDLRTLKKIAAAFVPTGVIGLLFYRLVKTFLLGNSSVVLWSLLLGGIFIIIFELSYRKKDSSVDEINSVSYRQALLIGIFQSLAIIPGVSRSAATIIGGLMLGLKRKTIVEFSFLLAVPTMVCATGLDLAKTAHSFTFVQFKYLFIGFTISFIAALLAIKFLLSFIRNNGFILFGVYRIILALLLWSIFRIL